MDPRTHQHSFDNFGLHQAAARGDDERVHRAIELGADINALDNTGRTVIACAVAGDNWEKINASDATFMSAGRLRLLSALVGRPDISLYTLNAPQSAMRGVTPLGMAAWLNMPRAVRVLLDESLEALSVDGMDTHGATALMYAARDGSLEVVQCLLQHGARPDFRDVNHRTSIHYSLAHPQILWLCEGVLRRHRWRESESANKIRLFSDSERLLKLAAASLPPTDTFHPPASVVFDSEAISKSTNTLIQAIQSSELSFLHSLLFSSPRSLSSSPSPILVNRLDSKGWGAIHHCVSVARPSVDVLDALYCAGCDVSLFTTHEHYTPLHCLARSARHHPNDNDASALYQFTIHLVRDLRAPLSARDKQDETCIHVAAEHGESIDVLIAFLDCDTTGYIRGLRNSRGLTALQVARPEFCAAFGEDAENIRPSSSLSMRTIRPVASFGSMSSVVKWTPPSREVTQGNDDDSLVSSSDYNVSASSQQLLTNLRLTSPTLNHDPVPATLDYLDSLMKESVQIGRDIIQHFRARVDDAVSELDEAKTVCNTVSTLRRVVKARVDVRLDELKLDAELIRRRQGKRESEDSQETACDDKPNNVKSFSTPELRMGQDQRNLHKRDVGISTDPQRDVQKRNVNLISGRHVALEPDILENLVRVESRTNKAHVVNFLDMDDGASTRTTKEKRGGLRREANLKLWTKALKEEWAVSDQKVKAERSGTAKFRAWLRRKIAPEPPCKLEIVRDIDEKGCSVGRDVKCDLHAISADQDALVHKFLPRSHVILAAADRDLVYICQRTTMAEQFIKAAHQSVLRAEHIIQKALTKRAAAIASLRSSPRDLPLGENPNLCGRDATASLDQQQPPQSPTSSSSASSSARSSITTLSALLPKGDDEDTKALQRLLLRKIEARMVGAFDEIDKVASWLQIVKEVVRGVKRRTYL